MDQNEIFNRISKILKVDCGVEQNICLESNLNDDLYLDSIGMLGLLSSIENQYQIILDENKFVPPPETVEDLVRLSQEVIKEKNNERLESC